MRSDQHDIGADGGLDEGQRLRIVVRVDGDGDALNDLLRFF